VAVATACSLTGDDLTVEDVWAVAVERGRASISDASRERVRAAREVVINAVHGQREHTYGVNTGFGRFVSRSIPEELTEELQVRLLRSHSCGVGEPYPDEIVRAAMLLRANALAKGTSGARFETVTTIENHSTVGGLGSAVCEVVAELGLPVVVRRLGVPDRWAPAGSLDHIRRELGLDAAGIAEVVA